MGTPLRLLSAVLLFGAHALAQIVGDFYVDRTLFASGEPVVLHFRVTNNGHRAVNILQAEPESFCSGYQITLSTEPDPHSSCATGFAGDCLSSDKSLKAGETQTENILLNFQHEISKPGDYDVEAVRVLPYADAALKYFEAPKQSVEVRTKIYFRIDQSLSVDLAMLQPFVHQLHSRDMDKRREAARTLASIAPTDLESTLLKFPDNAEFRQFAPLAFHRLNTPRSMQAMAELLAKTEPGSYENMASAEYLSQTGDSRWFPLLKEVAVKNAKIASYVTNAADLGGDKMFPVLLNLMTSPDKEFTRVNAISGLSHTHTRDAVPILLELLQHSDSSTASFAQAALQALTHRTAYENGDGNPDARSTYLKWAQWWARDGPEAPIYKGSDCGDVTPLP